MADEYIQGEGRTSPANKDDYFGYFKELKQIFI